MVDKWFSLPSSVAAGTALASLALLSSCGSGSGGGGGDDPAGPGLSNPNARFLIDPHQNGTAQSVRLVEMLRARLVDVYDFDPVTQERVRRMSDFAIGEDVASDGTDYELRWSHVQQKELLTILHPSASAGFERALEALQANAIRLGDSNVGDAPPFGLVQRNAALVLRFDDLLVPESVNGQTVHLQVDDGLGNLVPFEARIVPDRNFGDLADFDGNGAPEFYTTRVIVDMTVSAPEAAASEEVLTINPLGLPAATADAASVVVRIPTRANPAVGQVSVVSNPSGAAVSFLANGSNDPASPTRDLVRAFRSGSALLGDPHLGNLDNGAAPAVLGAHPIVVERAQKVAARDFIVALSSSEPSCRLHPEAGDGLEFAEHVFEVVQATKPAAGDLGGELSSDILITLVSGSPATFAAGLAGDLVAPYEGESDENAACFVRWSPEPGVYPNGAVDPSAVPELRFSEPMDASTVSALNTFDLLQNGAGNPTLQRVVGVVERSQDEQRFRLVPRVPMAHAQGTSEDYRLVLAGGPVGVRDVTGMPLGVALPEVEFQLDPAAASADTGGISLTFDALDENKDGFREWRGQFLRDLDEQQLVARPVTRFSSVVDESQPVVGAMVPCAPGVADPLNPYGSKVMNAWRYHDVGFELTDEGTMNVDVEFLNWAPEGNVLPDSYDEYRMSLSHSFYLPDEVVDQNLLPIAPFSGLVKEYDQNHLNPLEDRPTIVHPKADGYLVDPADAFVSTTGTLMMPWPMNRGVPASDRTTYTWRDTALTSVGGPNGFGVDTRRLIQVTGSGQAGLYPQDEVPTIGLPLMMEFRCYPDSAAFGQNSFKVNIALNSSARPNFRAWSGGGVLNNGTIVLVDPDATPVAKGGIVNGMPTPPGREVDNTFYLGQADFVVRVSRAHTIWFDTAEGAPLFSAPVLEPQPEFRPDGVELRAAFRGADSVAGPNPGDIDGYDFYGDSDLSISFTNGDAGWKSDPSALDGARYVQMRLSQVSNIATGLSAPVTAVGLAYRQP